MTTPAKTQTIFLAKNKKAYFDYEVTEKVEAGIVLTGAEVKSVRSGRLQLKGSYARVVGTNVVFENMHISHYPPSPVEGYDPLRRRTALLHKKEIENLAGKSEKGGYTLIPLEVILKRNLVKVVIGVCRGKKAHDKRDTIKKRDVQRDISQGLKSFSKSRR